MCLGGFFMNLAFEPSLILGKIIAYVISKIDDTRGTNISGKICTKICKNFIWHFKNIDYDKVIFITGTNGKSTTTNLIAHIIKSSGRKVATNSQGANMMGGIATVLIKNSTIHGKFKSEYLVLEIKIYTRVLYLFQLLGILQMLLQQEELVK